MMRTVLFLIIALSVVGGCSRSQNENSARSTTGSNRVFQVKGTVKDLNPNGKTVSIRHEEVPNFMPAMTMAFTARDPKELAPLKPGDVVSFRMTVTADDVWIDQIRKLDAGEPASGS